MKMNTGYWVAMIGLIILGVWLSMMPLYKYPSSTDPFYAYLNSMVWMWFIAGPTLIVIGVALAIRGHVISSDRR